MIPGPEVTRNREMIAYSAAAIIQRVISISMSLSAGDLHCPRPRDVVVSQYHFSRKRNVSPINILCPNTWGGFVAGQTFFTGPGRTRSQLARNPPWPAWILLLRYEDMVEDTRVS